MDVMIGRRYPEVVHLTAFLLSITDVDEVSRARSDLDHVRDLLGDEPGPLTLELRNEIADAPLRCAFVEVYRNGACIAKLVPDDTPMPGRHISVTFPSRAALIDALHLQAA